MNVKATIANPGYLKLELMTRGMKISRAALDAPEIVRAIELSQEEGVALELGIVLHDDVLVNIPIHECLAEDRPYTLVEEAGRFYIKSDDDKVRVFVAGLPDYYERMSTSGAPMYKIGRVYGGYLAISPTPVCEFIKQDLACRYCDLEAKKGRAWTVEEVVETVEAALSEGAAEYVALNVGFTDTPDGGIALLEPYVKSIKSRFDVLVCVQAQPPQADKWIDMTYAMGVDSIAYNLEAYDPEVFNQIAPGKMGLLGRDRYFEALRYAAKVFPSGAVVSNLIVGLEPIKSTLKGISVLAAMGVIPTLPIYRPGVGDETHVAGSAEALAPIYLHLQEALLRNRLSPTWVSHFNLALNAIEGHFFGGEAPLKQGWQRVLKTKHGGRIAHGISNVRRRLRVRSIDDEASGSH